MAGDRKKREISIAVDRVSDIDSLKSELKSSGFIRELKYFQLENLEKILAVPHGADFSVPGAGKTTVALANFLLNKSRGNVSQLLVIAPIAAFEAWKEDSKLCIFPAPVISTHGGVDSLIPENTEILLTNYNRVVLDYDRIRSFVAKKPTQVILDEAHRIKRGGEGVHGRAVLDLAYAATRRDILTGTPAPQGAYDLIALMSFLYPGQDRKILPDIAYQEKDGRDPEVLISTKNAISPYFVRTTKSKLDLPRPRFEVIRRPMGKIQNAIYTALIGQYRSEFTIKKPVRREFDRMGKIMMYLLEAATNPLLLPAGSDEGDDYTFSHPPFTLDSNKSLMELLQAYHLHETPWKYLKIMEIIQQAATNGEKVIIWSNFVRNLKALNRYLKNFNPAMIHGGVPTEENASPGVASREAELFRFRRSDDCTVLLANPAACGEGISLHHDCHHAIYLDRTFNAGQFLQSQDRIHRLGLDKDIQTTFSILVSGDTIDDSVDSRLREKVDALSKLMNDPGLVLIALPEPDIGNIGSPIFKEDFEAVLYHIAENT